MMLTPLGAAKNGGKQLVKTAAKEGAEFVSENVVKTVTKTTGEFVGEKTAENIAKVATKETAEVVSQNLAKTTAKEVAGETAENIAKTTAKESTEFISEKLAKDATKDGAESVVKTAEKKAVEDSTKTSAKKSADDVGESTAKTASENVAKTGKIFTKSEYEAPSGITYRVYQQEIDINLLIEKNGVIKTNLEWMKLGQSPSVVKNGKVTKVVLHHSQQNGLGPLFELSETVHRKYYNTNVLHPYLINTPKTHPENPVDRVLFDNDRRKYWMNRADDFKRQLNLK